MTEYCKHELPIGSCALCTPRASRRGDDDAFVVTERQAANDDGSLVTIHLASCAHASPERADRAAWPRREVSRRDASLHPEWKICKACKPDVSW